MKPRNFDPWDVITFWASNQIHPKYGVTYEVIVSDLGDFPAYYNNDIDDVEYYECLWRQRYNLTVVNENSIRNFEDEVWAYLMEEAEKDNAFESYTKVNEQNAKVMLDYKEIQSQAETEGWGIFYTSIQDDKHNMYELQRLDEMKIFESDDHAIRFVTDKAMSGSTAHTEAIKWLIKESPTEISKTFKEVLSDAQFNFIELLLKES